MLSPENLAFIRSQELEDLLRYLVGRDVLEVGAGSGHQARALAERGFVVSAVDLPGSGDRLERVYPVLEYDGTRLPFPDRSFDLVFSSNVLEHVRELPALLAETARVLRPGGYAIHTMPTPAWRSWSTVSGYLDVFAYLAAVVTGRLSMTPLGVARAVAARLVPLSHGKRVPALLELWAWRRRRWIEAFERAGFEIMRAEPMNLFYTGWCVFGRRWPIAARRRAARWLGSASCLYQVRPVRRVQG